MKNTFRLLFWATLLLCSPFVFAQSSNEANYDESKVPKFTLPDVLTCDDGTRVTSARQWEKHRRPELLKLFSEQEYGYTPNGKVKVQYKLLRENKKALEGLATQQQILMTFKGEGRSVEALMLVYIPNQRKGRVPVFIGYNFQGNHSLNQDEEVLLSPYFQKLDNNSESPLIRGSQASRWPLQMILGRGYALVTMCYNDIFPDNAQGGPESVKMLFKPSSHPDSDWQALGAWAWGNSRMADWVCKQRWANNRQLIVIGHSRQGKAALWAGAQDKRFKVVISNESGCGGAALSKREYGERVARITQAFPHWFCANFSNYAGREQDLPFDQHELLALIAPRALYVASAEEDRWADPLGEYLSAYYASSVYKLYGLEGLSSETMPQVHQPIMNQVAYHIRTGIHDVTDYDWKQYLDYCDMLFRK